MRKDCTCGAKHRKECVCDGASIEAILADQNRPGQREAIDRAFNMTPEELGQAAVDGAQRTQDCPSCRPDVPCWNHSKPF